MTHGLASGTDVASYLGMSESIKCRYIARGRFGATSERTYNSMEAALLDCDPHGPRAQFTTMPAWYVQRDIDRKLGAL